MQLFTSTPQRAQPAARSVAVFEAPVDAPQCIAWCPRTEALWVGARNGMVLCDRMIGQQLYALKEPPAALCMRNDGEVGLLIGQSGTLSFLRRTAALPGQGVPTGLHGRWHPFSVRGRFFLSGIGPRGGRLLEVQSQGLRRIARLPDGATAGPGATGPEVVRLIDGRLAISNPEATGLRASDAGTVLRHCGAHLVSWGTEAVCVWRHRTDAITTLAQQVTCVDVSPDGRWLALGTLSGELALVDLDHARERRHPDLRRISTTPVRAVKFSPGGGHLASLGDSVDVWDNGGGDW